MIGTLIFILLCIIIFEFVIFGLKYLLDETEENKEYYRLCDNCPAGFCMEDPNSEECKKIRREHNAV